MNRKSLCSSLKCLSRVFVESLTLSLSLMSSSLDSLSPLSLGLPLKFYIYLFLPVTTLSLSPSSPHLGHPQCGSLLAKFKLCVCEEICVLSFSQLCWCVLALTVWDLFFFICGSPCPISAVV